MDQDLIKIDLFKIKLKDLVSNKIVDMIAKKELPYKQIQEMAVDFVDALKEVKSKDDLLKLVSELANIYPYLKDEAVIMNKELEVFKEEVLINKLQSYFKNLSH